MSRLLPHQPSIVDRTLQVLIVVAVALMLAALCGMLPARMPQTGVFATLALALALARMALRALATDGLRRPFDFLRRNAFVIGLTAIAAAGLVARLLGIAHGPGHVPTDVDENRLAQSVMHFFRTGTIEHDTVEHYPGIHFWLLAASFLVRYLWGLMTETMRAFGDSSDPYVVAGRCTNAVLDFGSIVLTGLLGRSLVGPGAGLLSAGLFAAAPLAIVVSSQLRNEAALVLCVVAATYAAVLAADSATRRPALLGGMFAGLAAAIKYSGVFALLPVILASLYAGTVNERVRRIGVATAGFVVALAITNHFLWADFPNFIRQLSTEVTMTGGGHWAAMSNPRWYYPHTLAEQAFGWPIVIAAGGFTLYSLAAGYRPGLLLVAFPLTYFWFMASRPSQFPRWVYTITPFVAVASVGGLWRLRDAIARLVGSGRPALVRVSVAALGLLGVAPLVMMSATEISRRPTVPPYALAETWLSKTASPGDRVLSEAYWLDLASSGLKVQRVKLGEFRRSLGAGDHELNTFQWIVVPETYFNDPNLKRLVLLQAFDAKPRFGGNAGIDIRVYGPPPLPPVDASSIDIGTAASAPFLGLGWNQDPPGQPGAVLDTKGGWLYVPAPTREQTHLEFEILAEKTPGQPGAPPFDLKVDDAPVALAVVQSSNGRARVVSAEIPRAPTRVKAIALSLVPRPGSGAIRFFHFAIVGQPQPARTPTHG